MKIDAAERELAHRDKLRELEASIDGLNLRPDKNRQPRDLVRFELAQVVDVSPQLPVSAKKEVAIFLFSDSLIIASVKKKVSKRASLQTAVHSSSNVAYFGLLEGNKFKLLLRESLDCLEITSDQPSPRTTSLLTTQKNSGSNSELNSFDAHQHSTDALGSKNGDTSAAQRQHAALTADLHILQQLEALARQLQVDCDSRGSLIDSIGDLTFNLRQDLRVVQREIDANELLVVHQRQNTSANDSGDSILEIVIINSIFQPSTSTVTFNENVAIDNSSIRRGFIQLQLQNNERKQIFFKTFASTQQAYLHYLKQNQQNLPEHNIGDRAGQYSSSITLQLTNGERHQQPLRSNAGSEAQLLSAVSVCPANNNSFGRNVLQSSVDENRPLVTSNTCSPSPCHSRSSVTPNSPYHGQLTTRQPTSQPALLSLMSATRDSSSQSGGSQMSLAKNLALSKLVTASDASSGVSAYDAWLLTADDQADGADLRSLSPSSSHMASPCASLTVCNDVLPKLLMYTPLNSSSHPALHLTCSLRNTIDSFSLADQLYRENQHKKIEPSDSYMNSIATERLWLCMSNGFVSHISLVILKGQNKSEVEPSRKPLFTMFPSVRSSGDICKSRICCAAQVLRRRPQQQQQRHVTSTFEDQPIAGSSTGSGVLTLSSPITPTKLRSRSPTAPLSRNVYAERHSTVPLVADEQLRRSATVGGHQATLQFAELRAAAVAAAAANAASASASLAMNTNSKDQAIAAAKPPRAHESNSDQQPIKLRPQSSVKSSSSILSKLVSGASRKSAYLRRNTQQLIVGRRTDSTAGTTDDSDGGAQSPKHASCSRKPIGRNASDAGTRFRAANLLTGRLALGTYSRSSRALEDCQQTSSLLANQQLQFVGRSSGSSQSSLNSNNSSVPFAPTPANESTNSQKRANSTSTFRSRSATVPSRSCCNSPVATGALSSAAIDIDAGEPLCSTLRSALAASNYKVSDLPDIEQILGKQAEHLLSNQTNLNVNADANTTKTNDEGHRERALWLGCADGSLLIFNCFDPSGSQSFSECANAHIELQLEASVCDIAVANDECLVVAALANGKLALFERSAQQQVNLRQTPDEETGGWQLDKPTLVDVVTSNRTSLSSITATLTNSSTPTKQAVVEHAFKLARLRFITDSCLWCSFGSNVFVLQRNTGKQELDQPFSLVSVIDVLALSASQPLNSKDQTHACCLEPTSDKRAVWICLDTQACVHLFASESPHLLLATVALGDVVARTLSAGSDILQQHKSSKLRATSLLTLAADISEKSITDHSNDNARTKSDALFIGTSAGIVLCLELPLVSDFLSLASHWVPNLQSLAYGHSGQVRFLNIISVDNNNNSDKDKSYSRGREGNLLLVSGGCGFDCYDKSCAPQQRAISCSVPEGNNNLNQKQEQMKLVDCHNSKPRQQLLRANCDDDNLNHLIFWNL